MSRRWGSIPLRTVLIRPLYLAAVLALVVAYLWSLIANIHAGTGNGSTRVATLDVPERLTISDTTLDLSSGSACVAQRIPWRIEGYGSRYYQIEWTVSHDQGRPWNWKHVTEDAEQQGDLVVLICPDVAGTGSSRFTVTGVVDVVTIRPPGGGTSPAATGHLSVRGG